MIKKLLHISAFAVLALVCATTLSAGNIPGSINLPTNFNSYVYYQFQATDGNSYGEYVAPYPSTVVNNGATYAGFLACYDINNPTDVGSTYNGYFVTPSRTDVVDTEVSWLLDRVDTRAVLANPNPAFVGPIAMAIWQLEFSSSTNSEGGSMPIDPAAQIWIQRAEWAYNHGYTADKEYFVPDDNTSQRFGVIQLGPVSTPEPGTLLMLGSGVLGIAGVLRRKLFS